MGKIQMNHLHRTAWNRIMIITIATITINMDFIINVKV
jgi:hypothetical protein